MIRVFYDPAEPEMTVVGHAGAGEKGGDLVCAAASILAGTLKACAGGHLEEGCALFRGGRREVYSVIWRGFRLLAERYPENVRCLATMEERTDGNGRKPEDR